MVSNSPSERGQKSFRVILVGFLGLTVMLTSGAVAEAGEGPAGDVAGGPDGELEVLVPLGSLVESDGLLPAKPAAVSLEAVVLVMLDMLS